jgi:hypothetical protein
MNIQQGPVSPHKLDSSSFITISPSFDSCQRKVWRGSIPREVLIAEEARRQYLGHRKANRVPNVLRLAEDAPPPTSKGWAEMIRKVYEADPLICPRCGGRMRVVAFLTEYSVVDRITRHLKLTFVAEKPPPAHVFEQTALMAAEESEEYE